MRTAFRGFLAGWLILASMVTLAAERVWIDVRTPAEYAERHIDGEINIPHQQITEQIAMHVADKNTEIRLYCRSGNRAGKAKQALEAAGYSNVINAGSIDDVQPVRFDEALCCR